MLIFYSETQIVNFKGKVKKTKTITLMFPLDLNFGI